MKLNILTPRKFLTPLLAKSKSVDSNAIAKFKNEVANFNNKVKEQLEIKNGETTIATTALIPFTTSLGYQSEPRSQNGQSGIDLAIIQDGIVNVIIEVKKPKSNEMVTHDNANVKAFHEAILYFMRERKDGNLSVKHIIISDFNSWYVIDANQFDKHFWQNIKFKKKFEEWAAGGYSDNRTQIFYKEIAKPYCDELDVTFDCAYFDICQKIEEKELVAIYKLLSADNLLKQFNPNDANALNRDFYNELLYILGLEETKIAGKKIIGRAVEPQSGSLYENITNKLSQYGKPADFESVIRLIIIWINRLLFLKLLESQIVVWTNNKSHKFLHKDTISQYDQLEGLFFEILAKRVSERINTKFNYIPYLNSSLFEIHADEKALIAISNLSDDAAVTYFKSTVVKEGKNKRKTGSVNTLEYLFEFLDAYDFSNDSKDEVVSENKILINASVLGLIFEKINGYKDGSFYTPSFITMYMARESIRQRVIDKFSTDNPDVKLNSWEGLKSFINSDYSDEFRLKANNLINCITICDPAVGSGHFLVSALNELVLIKHELGLFQYKNMRIELHNDDLQVMLDDEWFVYQKPKDFKSANHVVQKILFIEKQRIIENQLFGVDINPNSVNICRLRLWIELLKNAYYKDDGTLETLPNIDINIKCGNSLISRFGLKDDIKNKKIKDEIESYKQAVKNYKENVGDKHKVLNSIEAIKSKFSTTLKVSNRASKNLDVKLKEWVSIFGYKDLDDDLMFRAFKANQHDDLFGFDENIAQERKGNQKLMMEVLKQYQREFVEFESGKIYENAFEWRFEFPEVLDENGDYVGFDVVIGNPPYIFSRELMSESDKKFFYSHYQLTQFKLNTYVLFTEISSALINKTGAVSLIIPNNWLSLQNNSQFREFILNGFHNISVVNDKNKTFEEASVDASILMFSKTGQNYLKAYEINGHEIVLISDAQKDSYVNTSGSIINYQINENQQDSLLINKINMSSIELSCAFEVSNGVQAYTVGEGEPVLSKEMKEQRIYHSATKHDGNWLVYCESSDVKRYGFEWSGQYIKYGKNLSRRRVPELFRGERIFVRQIPAKMPYAIVSTYLNSEVVCDNNYMVVRKKENAEVSIIVLLGILNSKMISFWFSSTFAKHQRKLFPQFKVKELLKFPIPKSNTNSCTKLEKLISRVLTTKEVDPKTDIKDLENQIDQLVYRLYELTYDEVKIIDPDFLLSVQEYEALIIE